MPDSWKTAESINAGPGVALPVGLEHVSRPLFEHQKRAIRELDGWWRGEARAGVLCLPTGGGKTRTAVAFALRHLSSDNRVLWLAHRDELVTQAIATFVESSADGIRPFGVGRFDGKSKVKTPVDIVVASIPTLAARRGGVLANYEALIASQQTFGLVVVDECHHATAKTWYAVVKDRLDAGDRVLGLSATPTRTNVKERPKFWKLFGDVVYEEPLLELIRHRILAKPRPIPVPTGQAFDASSTERKAYETFGDLPQSLVKRISDDHARNAVIVNSLVQNRSSWGATLVFAGSIDQSEALARMLQHAGLTAKAVSGTTRPEERRATVEDFKAGRLNVVVNVDLFTEGTDLPGVETVVIARPSRSRILFQQMVGRGMRGPLVGGSEFCNVIMFYDELGGLLEETLASTFTTEREAIAALDADELAEEPKTEKPAPRRPEDRPNAALVDDLIDYLGDLSRVNLEHLDGVSLVGWWEAKSLSEIAYLPVFEGDGDDIDAWVSALGATRSAAIPSSVRASTPATVLEAFRDAADRPDAELRYVDLDQDSCEALQALERRIRALDDDVRPPDWWRAASMNIHEPVVIDDDEGTLIAGRAALDELEIDLPSIRVRVERGHSLAEVADRFYDEESYGAWGLGRQDFQRLVRAALAAEGPPPCQSPAPPDENSVLDALRVVDPEGQREVLEVALEAGLGARYATLHDFGMALLAKTAEERTGVVRQLAKSNRFKDRAGGNAEEVLRAIQVIVARGGIVSQEDFASELDLAEYRVRGFVAMMAEALNVDGYRVVLFDEMGREVRLDYAKLAQIFEVEPSRQRRR
jgi:superfamily II DNA or RNA helicase/ATP:corrinoid adenosyltransferase